MRQTGIEFIAAFLAAFGIGAFINFGAGKVIDVLEERSEEMVYSDYEVGAAAGEGTPVVTSISEMMEEKYFTFHVTDIGWSNSIYYDGTVYDIRTMESGEKVLTDEYFYNSYYDSDEQEEVWINDNFTIIKSSERYKVLPVGRVVKGKLDDALIKKLEDEGYQLSDTSFYVDMRGDFRDFSREECEAAAEGISFLVGIIVFFLIRYVMIASGVFLPIIPLRFLPTWRKYVVYYGIVYYGDSIKKIISLRKEGRMEEAAYEFSKLAEIDEEEAAEAMEYWNEILGEGILHIKKETW